MYELEIVKEKPFPEITNNDYPSESNYLIIGKELVLSIVVDGKAIIKHVGRLCKGPINQNIKKSDMMVEINGRFKIIPAQYMRDYLTDKMFLFISETNQMFKVPFTKHFLCCAGGFARSGSEWHRIILKEIISETASEKEVTPEHASEQKEATPGPVSEQEATKPIDPVSEIASRFILCNMCNLPQMKRVVTDCDGKWHTTTCPTCYSKTSLCGICGIHRPSVKVSSENGMTDMITNLF